jgi:hypothetical protein
MRHLEHFLSRLEGVCETSAGWRACCPCPGHGGSEKGDSNPSLSIRLGEGDKILVHCFAGCKLDGILEAMELWYPDLRPGSEPDQPADALAAGPVDDSQTGQAADLRDPDLCHQVYSAMLERLGLCAAHRDNLQARGLTADQIQTRNYRTLTFFEFRQQAVAGLREQYGDKLLQVPGFTSRRGSVTAINIPNGIVIPVRDDGERIVAVQVRRDNEGTDGKYLWFSGGEGGTSCGTPVHVPFGVKPAAVVRVTESPLKADIAFDRSGLPTVGVPGVSNWAPAVSLLKKWGTTTARLAFDADAAVKKSVAVQLRDFAEVLSAEGILVELERWPPEAGKGIDDVLAAGGLTEVLAGEAAMMAIRQAAEQAHGGTDPGDCSSAPEFGSTDVAAGDANTDGVPAETVETVTPPPGDGQTPTLPAFPLETFPTPVADYASKMAASIGCPVDFVAHAILAVAAGAVGASRAVHLGGEWFEPAILYACIIGPPGSAKTPALRAAVKSVYRIQEVYDREFDQAEQVYEQEVKEYEAAVKAVKAATKAKKPEGNPPADSNPAALPQKPTKRVPVRIITSDATVEALAPVLKQNPRGLQMHRDELSAWVKAMDMYRGGRGADRQFYLQVWSSQDVVVDRKAQGTRPIFVPRPHMTVLGSIQPDLLGELADARGRQDGFLDRLLFAYPDAAAGQPWPDQRVGRQVIASWEKVLRRLYRLRMREKDDGTHCPRVLKLTDEAASILKGWWAEHLAAMKSRQFDAELLGGPFAKFRAHVARLALITHCVRYVCHETDSRDIDAESARRATRLTDYYKAHCRKVHARLRVAAEDKRAERIERWVRQNGGQCLARDLYRNEVAGIKTESDAKKALRDLEDRGRGECVPLKHGKKESIRFVLRG